MTLRLRRISSASLAATLVAIYFIVGLFVTLIGIIAAASGGQVKIGGPVGFSGTGASILPLALAYPFLTAFIGAMAGFLIAWTYNFSVRFTKGLLIEFTDVTPGEE